MKRIIKLNNSDTNIKINLIGNNNSLLGYNQEIEKFVDNKKNELINPIIDYEMIKFTYCYNFHEIDFLFTIPNSTYTSSAFGNIFPSGEITDRFSPVIKNSFFIMDVYDTYKEYEQQKLSTIYFTKIWNSNYVFKYLINSDIQLNDLYLPKYYIDNNVNNNLNLYVKFSFFNASNGNIYLFRNSNNSNLTSEKLYFKISINKSNLMWYFDENITQNKIKVLQIPINDIYAKKINDKVENDSIININYPKKTRFNSITRDYEDE